MVHTAIKENTSKSSIISQNIIDLTTHAQHLENVLQIPQNNRLQKQQPKCFQRTLKSNEHVNNS